MPKTALVYMAPSPTEASGTWGPKHWGLNPCSKWMLSSSDDHSITSSPWHTPALCLSKMGANHGVGEQPGSRISLLPVSFPDAPQLWTGAGCWFHQAVAAGTRGLLQYCGVTPCSASLTEKPQHASSLEKNTGSTGKLTAVWWQVIEIILVCDRSKLFIFLLA